MLPFNFACIVVLGYNYGYGELDLLERQQEYENKMTKVTVPFSSQSWVASFSGQIEFNGLFPQDGLDVDDMPDYEIITLPNNMPDLFFIFESEVDAVEFKLKYADILV
jgi:hypothetical protein